MAPTPFTWLMLYFATVGEFEAWLATLPPRAGWVKGLTVHHTWSPTVAEWRGRRSMEILGRYYRATMKWPQGPHLFAGPDGIWVGCPLELQGVHAGPCNGDHWSIEVVGDYDKVEWQEPIKSLAYGAIVALCRYGGFSERAINGHRDCMPGQKTCPGSAISMDKVRSWTKFLLSLPQGRPANTYQVDPVFAAYWVRSGEAWQPDRATLGWAITPGFKGADGRLYQLFERGGLRERRDVTPPRIEAMRTDEVEALKQR